MTTDELMELAGHYFDCGVLEGRERREVDTPDGAAQKALHALRTAIDAALAEAREQGRTVERALWELSAIGQQMEKAAPDEHQSQLDAVYLERNQVVAALAKAYPSGIAKTAIEGWDEAWHGCVYIDFPWGQASWHFHDRDAHLFTHLPPYKGEWDGHTTEEKYAAIDAVMKPNDSWMTDAYKRTQAK